MVTKRKIDIGPRTPEERRIFAWEETRVRLQHAVNARMRELGFTQASLAEAAGVSRRTIGRFFADDCHVTFSTLRRVVDELGLVLTVRVATCA